VKRFPYDSVALVALVCSAVGLHAAEGETFTGTAAATGTYKRPLLVVDAVRYELKASDKSGAIGIATSGSARTRGERSAAFRPRGKSLSIGSPLTATPF
jgi:hypothetical protein